MAREFRTTHWSVVLAAGARDSPHARQALGTLCGTYWYPLYAFSRSRGYGPGDAEDMVQEFFRRLIEKHYVAGANPGRGRFRSFLLAAFRHFLANEWDRQQAAKRGGGRQVIPWDDVSVEARYAVESAGAATPEALYERSWAMSVLEEARVRLREEYAAQGKAGRFPLLEPFLPGGPSGSSYPELSQRLGLSEVALRSEVHRLRRRFGIVLRDVVADLVAQPEEIDDELRALIRAVSE